MEEKEQKTVVFGAKELAPEEEAAYRERIRSARKGDIASLKSREPVGVVPRPAIPLQERAPVMGERKGILSPETANMLQEAAQAQAQQQHEEEKKAEKKEEEKKEEDAFDLFDFQARNEAERILNNKKRRQEIESRCEPMKLEDLIMQDEVRQLVPIVPKKFEVLFRSMKPDENLYIKQYLTKNDPNQSDQYLLEKYGILQLVCTVLSINGKGFPEIRDEKGDISEASFEVKLKMLLKKSGYVVADLGINYSWFDIRVRRLLNPDALGNG